jgi:DNA-binding GntR family transcriptional regulator
VVRRPPTPASDGPRTSVGELTDRLQDLILSGRLAGGSWLRQERLAGEFGVSRTPIREALRALATRGLVELHDHRGAIVCVPSARDIREAYAVRAELEGYAAELAALWARDSDLRRLAEAAERFERLVASDVTGEPAPVGADLERPAWQEANDRFHVAVLEAAGNRRLRATIDALHTSFPRNLTWSALSGHSGLLAENVEQHREILRMIEGRDPAGARAGMVAHVRRAGELVAHRLDRLATGDPDG